MSKSLDWVLVLHLNIKKLLNISDKPQNYNKSAKRDPQVHQTI